MNILPRFATVAALSLALASTAFAGPRGARRAPARAPAVVVTAPQPAVVTPRRAVVQTRPLAIPARPAPVVRQTSWRRFNGVPRLVVPRAAGIGDTLIVDGRTVVLVDRVDNLVWFQRADGRRERFVVVWTV